RRGPCRSFITGSTIKQTLLLDPFYRNLIGIGITYAHKTSGLPFMTNAPAILAMLEGYDATNKPPTKAAP
ncbi:MAG: hypothetical protein ABMA26_24240, partial [Limisphaerales bacterium]